MSLASVAALLLLSAEPSSSPMTLEDALDRALNHANEMIQAREDVVLVDTQYMEALSAVLPSADLNLTGGEIFAGSPITEARFPNAQRLDLPGQLPQFVYGPFVDGQANNFSNPAFSLNFSARQLIYDGGRWWTVLARVEDSEASAKAALDNAKNNLVAAVTTAFYALFQQQQSLATMETQLDYDRAQLDRARKLAEAGRGTQLDVVTAARNLANDEIIKEQRRLATVEAAGALAVQIGQEPTPAITLAVDPAVMELTTPVKVALPPSEKLIETALQERPDLRQLRADIRARHKDVLVEEADYWPVVTLEASYRRNSRRPDRVFNDPTENYRASLDLVVRWNLFQGRATDARVQRAEITLRKEDARLKDQGRRVMSDVLTQVARVNQAVKIHALALRQIEAAEEAVRMARGRYSAGAGTALELRDAEVSLTNARLSALDARVEIELAQAQLTRAVARDPDEVR